MSAATSFQQGFFTGFAAGSVLPTTAVGGIVPLSLTGGAALGVALLVSYVVVGEVFHALNEKWLGADVPFIAKQVVALAASTVVAWAGAQFLGIPLLFIVVARVVFCASIAGLGLGYLKVHYDNHEVYEFMQKGE